MWPVKLLSLAFACIIALSCRGDKPVSDFSQTREVDKGEVRELKILSWNIYMLPPIMKFTGKKKRAVAIAEKILSSDYDVIVFQEAFHAGARALLSNRLKQAFPYQVGPVNPARGFKTSSGIWFVSRHPIKLIGVTEFRQKAGIDNRLSRKGAGLVKLEMGDKTFHIIGTHLNAGGDISIRHSQVLQIRDELINRFYRKDIPLILCGDKNIRQDIMNDYTGMINILSMEDCITGDPPKATANHPDNQYSSGNRSPQVIDYCFYRLPEGVYADCDVPVKQQQWSRKRHTLSDHEPVFLRLSW